MKELIGVYTTEMARKDYEENNIVVKATKHYVKFAEGMIEKKAKEGRNVLLMILQCNHCLKNVFPIFVMN